jgi:hypothetical protein
MRRPKIVANHVRVLAYLNIALGGLGLLAAAVIFTILGGISGALAFVDQDLLLPGSIVALVATAILGIILILSLPFVIAGFGLLGFNPWARIMMLVLSAFHLFNIPFGTALAVYGFWVLLKPETEQLFLQRA